MGRGGSQLLQRAAVQWLQDVEATGPRWIGGGRAAPAIKAAARGSDEMRLWKVAILVGALALVGLLAGVAMAASRQVVYEHDRRVILAW